MSTAPVEPTEEPTLPEGPESLTNHDMYVNKRFNAIFNHEDNEDVVRMLVMGLATNDPLPPVVVHTSKSPGLEDEEDGHNCADHEDGHDEDLNICPAHGYEHWEGEDREDTLMLEDGDGDRMVVVNVSDVGVPEEMKATPGIVFQGGEEGFLMPIFYIPTFITWLEGRAAKYLAQHPAAPEPETKEETTP